MAKTHERQRILIVDDERQIRGVIAAIVEMEGYFYSLAEDAESALEILAQQHIDLLISDINMKAMSGLDLLGITTRRYPDLAVIMVTGVDDRETAIETLHMGAYGYVTKPFQSNELIINIANALRRRQLEIENRRHREELEILVEERTRELFKSREESIHILSKAAEFRDNETAKHTIRMGHYSEQLARFCELPESFCQRIKNAAPLHDVGKIGISDTILLKPGKLTVEEFAIMKTHCEIGFRILSESTSDILSLGAEIALNHHEKYDGSGYPRGLSGENIPITGRIGAICDVFDALTTERVYKKAIPSDQAFLIMSEGRSTHFDPRIIDHFLRNFKLFAEIRSHFSD
ncbi:MAG: response regulator [Proteobacteria bacterium]|nr:response regulator [Pseudomonadota bacterium]